MQDLMLKRENTIILFLTEVALYHYTKIELGM